MNKKGMIHLELFLVIFFGLIAYIFMIYFAYTLIPARNTLYDSIIKGDTYLESISTPDIINNKIVRNTVFDTSIIKDVSVRIKTLSNMEIEISNAKCERNNIIVERIGFYNNTIAKFDIGICNE